MCSECKHLVKHLKRTLKKAICSSVFTSQPLVPASTYHCLLVRLRNGLARGTGHYDPNKQKGHKEIKHRQNHKQLRKSTSALFSTPQCCYMWGHLLIHGSLGQILLLCSPRKLLFLAFTSYLKHIATNWIVSVDFSGDSLEISNPISVYQCKWLELQICSHK